MIRRPPRSPLFPYPPLFRSAPLDRPATPPTREADDDGAIVHAKDTRRSQAEMGPKTEPPRRGFDRRDQRRRSEEHTSELQSQSNLVCRLLLEKKKQTNINVYHLYKHYSKCTTPITTSMRTVTQTPATIYKFPTVTQPTMLNFSTRLRLPALLQL